MVYSMDISTCEIHLEGRTTHSGDDAILWKMRLEVGVPEQKTDHTIPYLSTLDIVGYLYTIIALAHYHLGYDDACISSEASDAMIWPGDRRLALSLSLDRVATREYILFSCTQ